MTTVLCFTVLTANMLKVASIVGAVDELVSWLTAVMATTNNDILVGMINLYGDPLIEDITFSIKQLALYLRVFTISHNAAIQLVHLLEAFLHHKPA
ncbi:hypothetical protein D3C76_1231990 [compost metagenome]